MKKSITNWSLEVMKFIDMTQHTPNRRKEENHRPSAYREATPYGDGCYDGVGVYSHTLRVTH